MTDKQRELLKQLQAVVNELSNECLNDDSFNNKLASMEIFATSLDEIIWD